MSGRNVHVVGTGTIGAPLTHLLARHSRDLRLERVTFHKRTPLIHDRSRILQLINAGAILATDVKKRSEFEQLQMHPQLSLEEALAHADVVIDCTPAGNEHRPLYETLPRPRGFVAQGSEDGFGKKYVRGINDRALIPGEDKYLQIVSCNTHNLAAVLWTLGYKNGAEPSNLIEGKFHCIRRANDLSQSDDYIPAPKIDQPKNERFGSHHAKDAYLLYQTLGQDLNLFSSSMKINTQYMHVVYFDLTVGEKTSREDLVSLIEDNALVALTHISNVNEVFSFGREFGFYGRILNQTVFAPHPLHVKPRSKGYQITGYCFTPQDGNSLLSSAAAALWLLDPETYSQDLQCLKQYVFEEI